MGCSSCGGAKISMPDYQTYNPPPQELISNENCPYTYSQLVSWLGMLMEVKNSATYDMYDVTLYKLNSEIGYLQSALNFPQNLCFYQSNLAAILILINKINGQ